MGGAPALASLTPLEGLAVDYLALRLTRLERLLLPVVAIAGGWLRGSPRVSLSSSSTASATVTAESASLRRSTASERSRFGTIASKMVRTSAVEASGG
jgi:hypothetical protein